MFSTAYQWLPWLMNVFCACMEVYLQICSQCSKLKRLKNLPMYLIMDCYVICCGVILIRKLMGGVRIKEELVLLLELIMWIYSVRKLIWIWFVERIKLSRKGMSSLPKGNWWLYFQHLITVDSLTILLHWWALMKIWCVLSKYWSQPNRKLPRWPTPDQILLPAQNQ